MRDAWYADDHDLVKWGILLRLACLFEAKRILQLAFYRPSEFGHLVIDGQDYDVPEEVISHFRNLRTIGSMGSKVRVTVFDTLFHDRATHLEEAIALLSAFKQERCIVFLDPDTGLEPRTPSLDHVLGSEARVMWGAMKVGDIFAVYQHQTNRTGQPWVGAKQNQLAEAIGVAVQMIKVASGSSTVQDVVCFYTLKTVAGATVQIRRGPSQESP